MRRRLWILLSIVLTGCIGMTVKFPGPDASGSRKPVQVALRTGVGGVDVTAVVRRIRSGLTRLHDDIPARRAQLHPTHCGSEKCYSPAEVLAAIAKIRSDASAAFPEEAVASRISLDDELARATAELRIATGPAMIQLVRNRPGVAPAGYRERSVDAAFERTDQPIAHYLAHRDLNPTIRIVSDPIGASFWMQIGNNDRTKYATTTDNAVESVWRGRYGGNVHKAGYRDPPVFLIDLMNDSRTAVRCTLVSDAAHGSEQSNCRQQD
jgi:hypothetical protein